MKFRFLVPALTELSEAAEYYEDQVVGLGSEFFDEAESTINRILSFPTAWGVLSDEFRHCSFRRFPYTIIYTQLPEDEILVVSVFHQKRRPLSWKHNL